MVTANLQQHRSTTLPQLLRQSLEEVAAKLKQPANTIHWVIAFSGGKDSAALAHAMHSLDLVPKQVTLAHIHHGLQAQADDWLAHCEAYAKSLGFNFHGEKVRIETGSRQSIEANARETRYQALRQWCRKSNGVLLIAQHEADQLETVLLQLKRGAGPKGLAGMAKLQTIANVIHVRPWLHCSQRSILDYVQEQKVAHIDDPSNQDSRFDRNFLRNEVIPTLNQRWSGLAKAVSRSAYLCAQQNRLIEEQVATWLQAHCTQSGSLPIKALFQLSKAWQAETLRFWCQQHVQALPSYEQLNAFMAALQSTSDKQPELVFSGCVLRRFSGQLYIQKTEQFKLTPAERVTRIISSKISKLSLASLKLALQFESSEAQLSQALFSFSCHREAQFYIKELHGDKHIAINANKTVKAKKLFKEHKIPPWLRQDTLGIFYQDIVIALVNGLGVWQLVDNQASNQPTNQEDNLAYLAVLPDTGPCQPV